MKCCKCSCYVESSANNSKRNMRLNEVGLNEGMLCNSCLTKIEKSSTRSKLAKVFMRAAFKDGGLNG